MIKPARRVFGKYRLMHRSHQIVLETQEYLFGDQISENGTADKMHTDIVSAGEHALKLSKPNGIGISDDQLHVLRNNK